MSCPCVSLVVLDAISGLKEWRFRRLRRILRCFIGGRGRVDEPGFQPLGFIFDSFPRALPWAGMAARLWRLRTRNLQQGLDGRSLADWRYSELLVVFARLLGVSVAMGGLEGWRFRRLRNICAALSKSGYRLSR